MIAEELLFKNPPIPPRKNPTDKIPNTSSVDIVFESEFCVFVGALDPIAAKNIQQYFLYSSFL